MSSIQPGDEIRGFQTIAVTPVDEVRGTAYQFRHGATGARVLHIHAPDNENLFSISFPTPPPDDTGVPHILEHAVLAGSRKYPVREPFFEMVKMSMATFINAMTGWDCTYYPVASNVPKDLFNLANVYFDAVFHPLLTDETFRREGHHLAPAKENDPDSDLTINGIVFNEMKGVFSDPEATLHRVASRALFPDTLYGRESGGDPDHIPELTLQGLRAFHRAHYHPGNALFVLYGNIPTADYLAFLADRLGDRPAPAPTRITERQPRWSAPRRVDDVYPIGPHEATAHKTYLLVEWLVGDGADPHHALEIEILSLILLGHDAAPLKKAIIDSKLGKDLLDSGNLAVGLETSFRLALKGSEPDRADAFLQLITDTLETIAAHPIAPDAVDSAFQQCAYNYREITSHFPLQVMDHVLDSWLYERDPLAFLRMSRCLDECRNDYRRDPTLFNRRIREWLLDNPHRLTVVLKPDSRLAARNQADFEARMTQLKQTFTPPLLAEIAEKAAATERLAGTPNPPEALALLPQLSVKDLPDRPDHIPTSVETLAGNVTLLRNDVFANGVNYLQLDINLLGLPAELWPYLPRYIEAFMKMGVEGMNYEEAARQVAATTGGLSCAPLLLTRADTAAPVWGLRVGMKALDDTFDPALDILRRLIFSVDPRDTERLRDVIVQSRAHYSTSLVQNGSHTAGTHAGRGFSPEGHLQEQMNGLPQMALINALAGDFDESREALMAKIEAVRDFLRVRERLTLSFTGSDAAADRLRAAVVGWTAGMRSEPVVPMPTGFVPYPRPPCEGLAGAIQVAHCARVMPALHYAHPDSPLLQLGAHAVAMDYLTSEVRLKGNAYGAFCSYHPLMSTLTLGSYRDPHITRTRRVFDGVIDFLRTCAWSKTDMERIIIGVAKQAERPIRPGEATSLAILRYLTGQTPERRERHYERMVSATAADVQRVTLAALAEGLPHSALCVVAGRSRLEKANREMADQPLAIENIVTDD